MVMSSRDGIRYSEIVVLESAYIYTTTLILALSLRPCLRVRCRGARPRIDSTRHMAGRIADADCHADAAQGSADSSARRRSFPLLCSHPMEAFGVHLCIPRSCRPIAHTRPCDRMRLKASAAPRRGLSARRQLSRRLQHRFLSAMTRASRARDAGSAKSV